MESTRTRRDHYEEDAIFGVEVYYWQSGTRVMRLNLKLLLLVISICNFASFICIVLTLKGQNERRRFPDVYIQKNKEAESQPGLSGSPGFGVDRVSPGQLLSGFLLRPGPVSGPGWPSPRSTRRAGPGFKTMS